MIGSPLDGERPGTQPVDHAPGLDGGGGRAQHRACAMGQQHPQVAVAALGDASDPPRAARGMFFGVSPNQAAKWRASRKWPTLPLVAATIAVAVSRPTPGNRQQRRARGRLNRCLRQLAFELPHARLEQPDLLDQQLHRLPDEIGNGRVRFGEHPGDLLQPHACALSDRDAELPAAAAQGVDSRSACGHPQRARPVQGLEGLLVDRLKLRPRFAEHGQVAAHCTQVDLIENSSGQGRRMHVLPLTKCAANRDVSRLEATVLAFFS